MNFNIFFLKGIFEKYGTKVFLKFFFILIIFNFLGLFNKRFQFMDSKKNKLHFIIFSKNRPSQIDLLIRSIKKMIKGNFSISVIYTYSNKIFLEGYRKLIELNKDIEFLSEKKGHLKSQILNVIKNSDSKYISLLVDDIVFINKFEIEQITKLLKNLDTFSLRLGKNIKWSYANQKVQIQPNFIFNNKKKNNFLIWDSKKNINLGDWSYMFSLDGNIFHNTELFLITKLIRFDTPNQYETQGNILASLLFRKYGAFRISKLLNIPDNIVQNDYTNRSEMNNPEYHINKFMNNNILCLKNILANKKQISTHVKIEHKYIRNN